MIPACFSDGLSNFLNTDHKVKFIINLTLGSKKGTMTMSNEHPLQFVACKAVNLHRFTVFIPRVGTKKFFLLLRTSQYAPGVRDRF